MGTLDPDMGSTPDEEDESVFTDRRKLPMIRTNPRTFDKFHIAEYVGLHGRTYRRKRLEQE